jgi:hypothetical protein
LNVEDALTTFRQQWQNELETSPQHGVKSKPSDNTTVEGGMEENDLNVESEVS